MNKIILVGNLLTTLISMKNVSASIKSTKDNINNENQEVRDMIINCKEVKR